MVAVTASKGKVLARILFRRRSRLKNKNLLIFYFEGVIGDIHSKNGSLA
jgi:hypothetical protein